MVMECGGVGYELNISLYTYSAFTGKASGKIYVYEVIREDAHLLYGFSSTEERGLYLLLTSVSGVGPNTARTILSSYPPAELVQVISGQDERALTAVKGIGLKTAQRILVDLKNKVKPSEVSALGGATATGYAGVAEDAVSALMAMGYQRAASQKVVLAILKSNPELQVEEVIKQAFRMF
jgi:Holliday junction DNA helicase RuvA